MASNKTIKRLNAALLLVIFAFSITPKVYLHILLANHKDTFSGRTDLATHVEKSGIHCNVDNLVVESPFVADNNIEKDYSDNIDTPYNSNICENSSASPVNLHLLRGPPRI